jgi:hypothetical protein
MAMDLITMNMNNRNGTRNSTINSKRFCHRSQRLIFYPPKPDKIFNKSPSNSQSLTNRPAIERTKQKQNISTVFTKVTVPFIELTQIKFLNLLFLNLTLKSINTILFQYTSYQEGTFYMLGLQVGAIVGEIHDLNSYIKREKIYDFKTNLWTDTRHLYDDNLTRTITVFIKKDIIKYTRPLDFENLTRSITIFAQKNIIKYSIPFNSYNVTRCLSVFVKDSKYLKKTILLYKYNLSRDILNSDQKYIINFITSSNPEPKLTLDLCNAKEHMLNDSQGYAQGSANAVNRGDSTTTIPSSIKKNYLNILLIVGIVLCLGAPSLIYTLTGVNIYDQYSITDSIYSLSLIKIRMCCATVFLHLLIYFYVLNKNRLKQYIFNKHVI